ncbi:MAG: signal peptidase I [Elusimicrobiales bacterium]|nr:signal peptidase I [Elusimicrobiales bacterium]
MFFDKIKINKKITQKKVIIALIMIIFFYIGMRLPEKISITTTSSLNKRIFYLSSPTKKFQKGQYIMITMHNKYINNGQPAKVIKKIGCAEGDIITIKYKNHYFCNGNFLGIAKEYSKNGEKVENFIYEGVIPEDTYFVIGDNPDSYDSRYYGFIRRNEIEKIAYPIF